MISRDPISKNWSESDFPAPSGSLPFQVYQTLQVQGHLLGSRYVSQYGRCFSYRRNPACGRHSDNTIGRSICPFIHSCRLALTVSVNPTLFVSRLSHSLALFLVSDRLEVEWSQGFRSEQINCRDCSVARHMATRPPATFRPFRRSAAWDLSMIFSEMIFLLR